MLDCFKTCYVVDVTLKASAPGVPVAHDSISVWPEQEPETAAQELALKFKPTLAILNGCQPYPAVDEHGNISAGLKPTGAPDGRCGDTSKAQVYARAGFHQGVFAIMYAWYMPKDSPSVFLGHRHEWENAVVWLDRDDPATAKVVAMAASAHGKYKKSHPVETKYLADGVTAQIYYKASWPRNHELGFTTALGTKQQLVMWEQLTEAAREALETAEFGSATVPFKSNFQANLAKAYFR